MTTNGERPCPEPPRPLLTGVASPCTPEHWHRVRELLAELMDWIEQESGIRVMDAQHDTRQEMASLDEYYGWPNGQFLVGVLDGRIVGTTGVRLLEPGMAELRRVWVTPEARGQGLAPLMLRKAIRVAEQLGAERLYLETVPRLMSDAVRMYLKAGFSPTAPYAPGLAHHPEVLSMSLVLGRGGRDLARAS